MVKNSYSQHNTYLHGSFHIEKLMIFKNKGQFWVKWPLQFDCCRFESVSFEKTAFEVYDFPYKSSRRHVDCDVLGWNANFQMAISCPVFDRILKVRPFLNSENFKFFLISQNLVIKQNKIGNIVLQTLFRKLRKIDTCS